MPARYWLSKRCFICTVKGHVVVLDTRDAAYHQFHASTANALAAHIHDWPTVDLAQDRSIVIDELLSHVPDVLNRLLADKILVTEGRGGRVARPMLLPKQPNVSLLDEYEHVEITVTIDEFIDFVRAALLAALLLSPRKKSTALRRLTRHFSKHRAAVANEGCGAQRAPELKRILAVFRNLRPLLWKSKHAEWLDRIVLLEMMRYRGLLPHWVFAVSAGPLRTHTWLQTADFVIDDSPGLISTFVPIMSI